MVINIHKARRKASRPIQKNAMAKLMKPAIIPTAKETKAMEKSMTLSWMDKTEPRVFIDERSTSHEESTDRPALKPMPHKILLKRNKGN